jgi:hypothetical protein
MYDVSEVESTSVIRCEMETHPTHWGPLDRAIFALLVVCCKLVLPCLTILSEDRSDVSSKCQMNCTRMSWVISQNFIITAARTSYLQVYSRALCNDGSSIQRMRSATYVYSYELLSQHCNTSFIKRCLLVLLCGLVVRVLGYRSGGTGSIPDITRKQSSGSGTGSTQPREYN